MKLLFTIFGVFLMLAGLVITPLPIPLGIIIFFIGLLMVISNSERAKSIVKSTRRRFKLWDKTLDKAEEVLPPDMAEQLEETRPDDDENDDEDKKVKTKKSNRVAMMTRRAVWPRPSYGTPRTKR